MKTVLRAFLALLFAPFLGCGSGGAVESNAVSHDATLQSMILVGGTLTPVFVSSTYAYTSNVASPISVATVTPTASNSDATITVNGVSVVNGHESSVIPLAVGDNTITVMATAADGVNTKTYVIVMHRASVTGSISRNDL